MDRESLRSRERGKVMPVLDGHLVTGYTYFTVSCSNDKIVVAFLDMGVSSTSCTLINNYIKKFQRDQVRCRFENL